LGGWRADPHVAPAAWITEEVVPVARNIYARARAEPGWTPRYDFRHVLDRLKAGEDPQPAPASRRRQGLPRRHHRPLHRALTGAVPQRESGAWHHEFDLQMG
jgi:hypothetical protein